ARSDPQRRSRYPALGWHRPGPARSDRTAGLGRYARRQDETRLCGQPPGAADSRPAHLRWHRTSRGAVPSGSGPMNARLKIWVVLVAVLAVSLVIAACAGHDWATPGDL